jgi:hypothetical protein
MRGESSVGLFYCLITLRYNLSPRLRVREEAAVYRYIGNIDMAVFTGKWGLSSKNSHTGYTVKKVIDISVPSRDVYNVLPFFSISLSSLCVTGKGSLRGWG